MRVLFIGDLPVPKHETNYSSVNAINWEASPVMRVISGYLPPHAAHMGIALIATAAKQAGFDVEVIEGASNARMKHALTAALSRSPTVVGISTTFIMDVETLASLVEIIRTTLPEAKIILGGPGVLDHIEMRKLGDYSILGEGENAIVALLESIRDDREPSSLPGVWISDKPIGATDFPRALLPDLDALPRTNWSLLQRNYCNEYLGISTQRGCKWRCAYCTYPYNEGYKLRYRSIRSLISEMQENYDRLGIRKYIISDSTFNHPHDRCIEFLEEVAKLPFRTELWAYARVDMMSERMVEAMIRAGTSCLVFGIESGDDMILSKMKKGFDIEQVRRGFRLLDGSGIIRVASWIVGFPGETPQTARATRDFIIELNSEMNQIQKFNLFDSSPVGMRKEFFGVSGQNVVWKHGSMSAEEASKLLEEISLDILGRGFISEGPESLCVCLRLGGPSRKGTSF